MKNMIVLAFLFFLSFAYAKDFLKVDCISCTNYISANAPISEKNASIMTTFVKKLEPMLDTKWMLISADVKNCPEYLEFRKIHNYIDYIDYTEYYGMKHRHNALVRSTKKIIIGKDKLADRIITTNFDGKHLHQKIEREFPIKSNWLQEISDYSFTEQNLHMTRDDRHFEVSYSCDYKLCKDLLCKL